MCLACARPLLTSRYVRLGIYYANTPLYFGGGQGMGWPMSCHKARLLVGWKSTNRAPKWGTVSAVTSILRESFTVCVQCSPLNILCLPAKLSHPAGSRKEK